MNHLTRRAFLKTSAIATAGIVLSARSWGQVAGANSDVRVAVVGLNGRGKNHLASLRKVPGVRIAAICDVDTAVLEKTAAELAKEGITPEKFTDVRELLASKNIDAITIATPNHWHSLMGIWACQAGKDVYVEKPISHNIREGRIALETARRHNRIVQHGTQSRSSASWARTIEVIRSGQLGRLRVARALCYK